MITGEIKNKLDKLWDAMWSNQMTNPWIDIQQITYLIFIKMLDDNQRKLEASMKDMTKHNVKVDANISKNFIFKKGNYVDKEERINVPYENLRWSVFKEWSDPNKVYNNLKNNIFPFIKKLNAGKATSFVNFMEKAEFAIPNPYILTKIIDSLSDEKLGFNDKDLMGDCYEYLLSKMSTSGDNGQFRTPRHIINLMVNIANPTIKSKIIDPAMGTAGFLSQAAKYIQENNSKELMKPSIGNFFHNEMFTGFDVDTDMLRIGCMNMTLHGVHNPVIEYNNSLSEDYTEKEKYNLILANPPFSGSLEPSTVSKSLNVISGGTKKTELLFLSLFLRLLEKGGRCVSIIPVGVLNNTNDKAYTNLRKQLVEKHKLEGIIYMPSGVFMPYSGVQTAIIFFTKTTTGGTDKVWLYNMENDGFSLDQKRAPIKEDDIPDIINRYNNLNKEAKRTNKDKSFLVSKDDIVKAEYVLSWNKYHKREVVKKVYRPTKVIISELKQLEKEFITIMNEIEKLNK